MKQKIAFIVQRYGSQINGGAETLTKMMAEELAELYDVSVLTGCAIDYHTWNPELPPGISYENNVRIIRFKHLPKQDQNSKAIHRIKREDRGRLWYQKLYRFLGRPNWWLKFFPNSPERPLLVETRWLLYQGPAMLELPEYLEHHFEEYSAYIFMTYLYYPTAIGMPPVGNKSILIPTLHDEAAAHLPIFKKVMRAPARIFFLTNAEKRFAEKTFDISHIPSEVVPIGIDIPADQFNLISKISSEDKFVLYAGRIEIHKGCDQLLEYFVRFKNENSSRLKLILIGKNDLLAVVHPDIYYRGFVAEDEKRRLMVQAKALIMPSKYESLSLVLLESFAVKTPVVANAESEVLSDHINESSGGWLYSSYDDFALAMKQAEAGKVNEEMGLNGFEYVRKNYSKERMLTAFSMAISDIERSLKQNG